MPKVKEPPKWYDVYPQGTEEGNEEYEFFVALNRDPKWVWRSVSAIAKESNLSKERVEQILAKYYKKKMVFQNSTNEDMWAYWQNVPDRIPAQEDSITDIDHADRLKTFNP